MLCAGLVLLGGAVILTTDTWGNNGGGYSNMETVTILKTDLANPVQGIEKVIFSKRDSAGNWETENTVTMELDEDKVKIIGAFVANTGANNRVNGVGAEFSSVLGGTKNEITRARESTIGGGSGNKIDRGLQSFIAGGEGNKIEGDGSSYSTILGGIKNQISATESTILGGESNRVAGQQSIIIGNNNQVTSNNSLAMGSGTIVNANNSFAWNDGKTPVTVARSNFFVINGAGGMVIGKETPHGEEKVDVNLKGDLRIQENTRDSLLTTNNAGIIKTINTGGVSCLCSGEGSSWKNIVQSTQCIQVCSNTITAKC